MHEIRINLPAVRANTRMTQDQWAKAVGVDKSTIVNWEAGKSEPSASMLRKMSELSGIPMDFIFCDKQS